MEEYMIILLRELYPQYSMELPHDDFDFVENKNHQIFRIPSYTIYKLKLTRESSRGKVSFELYYDDKLLDNFKKVHETIEILNMMDCTRLKINDMINDPWSLSRDTQIRKLRDELDNMSSSLESICKKNGIIVYTDLLYMSGRIDYILKFNLNDLVGVI